MGVPSCCCCSCSSLPSVVVISGCCSAVLPAGTSSSPYLGKVSCWLSSNPELCSALCTAATLPLPAAPSLPP
eukprot:3122927-Karenia_brevis.AAC.1